MFNFFRKKRAPEPAPAPTPEVAPAPVAAPPAPAPVALPPVAPAPAPAAPAAAPVVPAPAPAPVAPASDPVAPAPAAPMAPVSTPAAAPAPTLAPASAPAAPVSAPTSPFSDVGRDAASASPAPAPVLDLPVPMPTAPATPEVAAPAVPPVLDLPVPAPLSDTPATEPTPAVSGTADTPAKDAAPSAYAPSAQPVVQPVAAPVIEPLKAQEAAQEAPAPAPAPLRSLADALKSRLPSFSSAPAPTPAPAPAAPVPDTGTVVPPAAVSPAAPSTPAPAAPVVPPKLDSGTVLPPAAVTPAAPVQKPAPAAADFAPAPVVAPAPVAAPAPAPVAPSILITTPAAVTPAAEAAPAKASWMSRLRTGLSRTSQSITSLFVSVKVDENLFEELETALIMADAGVDAADSLLTTLRARVKKERIEDGERVKQVLREVIANHLRPLESNFDLTRATPIVTMIAGVNGAGKTTSIGKLARYFQQQGKPVLLAAGDTFRAAAREQLVEWGRRNNVTVIAQDGGDPAAVAFDSVQSGKARGMGVVMVDTAGRLPTQQNLMEELKKIRRVIAKADATAPHEVLLVIDGNTGQNALQQIKAFDDAIGLTGLIVTKLDGTAKGGILAAVAAGQNGVRPVPVYWIGVGEGIEDLQPFKADEFAAALLGMN